MPWWYCTLVMRPNSKVLTVRTIVTLLLVFGVMPLLPVFLHGYPWTEHTSWEDMWWDLPFGTHVAQIQLGSEP